MESFMEDFIKMVHSKWYIILIVFIGMPLNGIIATDNPIFAMVLMLCHVPWFCDILKFIEKGKNAKE